jgi:hypothetical protein
MDSNEPARGDVMRTLFLHISHGFTVRNFIYSGLAEALARDFRLVFLTPMASVGGLASLVGNLGEVVGFSPPRHPWDARLSFVRRYIMANPKRARTISLFSMALKAEKPWSYRALRIANSVFGRSATLRRSWVKIEQSLTKTTAVHDLFEKYRPAGVVASNYGTESDTIRLYMGARRFGVRSFAIIPSWDNLSSKGIVGAQPDQLLVWNEIMRSEAIELHDFAPEQIEICGPLQFDVYARSAPRPRADLCEELGLDPGRPFIVYGTITPRYFPNNWQVVRQLAEAVNSGELDPRLQILVRVHPQVVNDPVFGENMETYRTLVSTYPSVKLNVPQVMDWGALKPARPEDPELLAQILRHAAACIVPGSTLAIDALAAGCPAIGLAYDGDEDRPYESSIRRWYDYTYFAPLMKTGGLPLAFSREELNLEINAFLADRSRLLAERTAIVTQQLGVPDGRAALRAAGIVSQLLSGAGGDTAAQHGRAEGSARRGAQSTAVEGA